MHVDCPLTHLLSFKGVLFLFTESRFVFNIYNGKGMVFELLGYIKKTEGWRRLAIQV